MFSVVYHTAVTYDDYVYPAWAIGLGWVFASFGMLPLPIYACMLLSRTEGTLIEVA